MSLFIPGGKEFSCCKGVQRTFFKLSVESSVAEECSLNVCFLKPPPPRSIDDKGTRIFSEEQIDSFISNKKSREKSSNF